MYNPSRPPLGSTPLSPSSSSFTTRVFYILQGAPENGGVVVSPESPEGTITCMAEDAPRLLWLHVVVIDA